MEHRNSSKFFAALQPVCMLGALSLFAMLYLFVTGLTGPLVRYGFYHGPLLFYGLLEGIMILISVLAGAGFALLADIFIRQETYKPYLYCTITLAAVILVCGYWLLFYADTSTGGFLAWLQSYFPNFFDTGFVLPGIAAHFAALHWLVKRKAGRGGAPEKPAAE